MAAAPMQRFESTVLRTCPANHGLAPFTFPEPGWCDVCGCDLPAGAKVTGCRRCNWDVCMSCCPPSHMESPPRHCSEWTWGIRYSQDSRSRVNREQGEADPLVMQTRESHRASRHGHAVTVERQYQDAGPMLSQRVPQVNRPQQGSQPTRGQLARQAVVPQQQQRGSFGRLTWSQLVMEEHDGIVQVMNKARGVGFISNSRIRELCGHDVLFRLGDLSRDREVVGSWVRFRVELDSRWRPRVLVPAPGPPAQPGSSAQRLTMKDCLSKLHKGVICNLDTARGRGFIRNSAIHRLFGKDVLFWQSQLRGASVGDTVTFRVELDMQGRPRLKSTREASDLPQPSQVGEKATSPTNEAKSTTRSQRQKTWGQSAPRGLAPPPQRPAVSQNRAEQKCQVRAAAESGADSDPWRNWRPSTGAVSSLEVPNPASSGRDAEAGRGAPGTTHFVDETVPPPPTTPPPTRRCFIPRTFSTAHIFVF